MRRLLVIQANSTSPDPEIRALDCDGTFRCDRLTWNDLCPDTLRNRDTDVVVVLVTQQRDEMSSALRLIAEHVPGKPVLAILPKEAADPLLGAVLPAVDDFIVRPVGAAELRHRIGRLLAVPQHDEASISERLLDEMTLTKLTGNDPKFVRAVQQVQRFAKFDMSVLITGETGTGKELCARALHHLSRRQNHPFIAVDCGAVPDTLFENELFGHVRGAFTDAHRAHKGLVAMADGGTLFLDEIDALSIAAQAKLLRFLQEHTFRALGSDRHDRADVRVMAATNRDLDACVREKQLRADLYFRLNVLRLHLPPLRERPGDIPLLAQSVLNENRQSACGPSSFSAAALGVLIAHDWPGNVRELINVVQRAMVACDGRVVQPAHISIDGDRHQASTASEASTGVADFKTARRAALDAFERRYVEDLLRKHHGNVTRAARDARQDRRAFGRFIKKHQISKIAV
jgi:two-component system, NtrC family, response regulator GlrR